MEKKKKGVGEIGKKRKTVKKSERRGNERKRKAQEER